MEKIRVGETERRKLAERNLMRRKTTGRKSKGVEKGGGNQKG